MSHGHTYTKKIFIAYLKLRFNYIPYLYLLSTASNFQNHPF